LDRVRKQRKTVAKEKPKRQKKMAEEVAIVLRDKNRLLQKELDTQKYRVESLENQQLKWERRADAAEKQAEIFYGVIRSLAEVIPNTTARGRAARANARLMMESCDIKPPLTLGASRKRKPLRKKKKKKT
jgi:hypothetical protein